jgi:hypothetical protein
MSIENPISTTRKAIEMSAERIADPTLDGIKPKDKHYDEVFNKFRELKDSNPELLEKLIITLAKDKDLKNEMGSDLYSWFQVIWIEVNSRHAYKIRNTIKKMQLENIADPEKSKQNFITSINEIVAEMSKEIKIDPVIIHSFTTEKEKEILDKAITHMKESIIEAFA